MVLEALALSLMAADADTAQLTNPRAIELFERDARLRRWAVSRFDSDGDGRLSMAEAQAAANAFRIIADGDEDGRVTLYEFDRAKEFLVARYAL